MTLSRKLSRPSSLFSRRGVAGFVAIAASLVSASAAAQSNGEPAFDGAFSVQGLLSGPGPRNFLQTRGARTDGKLAWSAGFASHYGRKPFVVRSCANATDCENPNALQATDVNVVEHIFTTDFMGSFTILPWVQIGLRLPLTYVEGDGLTEDGQPDLANPVDTFGLGDIELEGKFRVLGEADSPLVLGVAPFIAFPTGEATAEGQYIGDNVLSAGLRGILDVVPVEKFRVAANLGYFYRGDGRVGSTELGMDFRYSAAASYQVTPLFSVLADLYGSTRFNTNNGSNTMEIGGAVEFSPLSSGVYFRLGGAGGILQGVGVPEFRGMLGVMYVHEAMDEDGDGIPDDADQCPAIAEDPDGFQDEDGCPDTDNDEDGVADEMDKCPDEAEDFDKFQDQDGCPEKDNDKDGIPDLADRCAMDPENINGYQDEDGCPDVPDSDNDGVPDDKDKCPNEAEDTDGFQDTDGCFDADNDGDGIPDETDECVDTPEDMNGVEDEDGCPEDE